MKVMIVGAGELGYKLAELMINEGMDVKLVDNNPKVIDRAKGQLDVMTINASGLEVQVLREENVEDYDLLIATTNSDETNMIICSVGKRLGCRKTIARVRDPEYVHQLDFIEKEIGIDHIVNPNLATANEISRYLLRTYNYSYDEFASGRVSMVDFNIGNMTKLVNKSLSELDNFEDLLIVAISRDGEIIIPHGATKLLENDIIYVVGDSKHILNLGHNLELNIEKNRIKKALILGGGKTGLYLAEQLIKSNIQVTIFEQDEDRCRYLSEKLDSALIINGDGTDINLLEEEGLSSMDAFIGVTGFDEQNLLMSLMAKQLGVKRTIAKVSRPSYIHLVDKLGIDFALDPTNIVAGDILKIVRGGPILSVSLLLGDQAEVMEIVAEGNKQIMDKPLLELGFPKGFIIGAIVRGKKVIIPKGHTTIKPLDRLVIFCLASNTPYIKNFMNPRKGVFR